MRAFVKLGVGVCLAGAGLLSACSGEDFVEGGTFDEPTAQSSDEIIGGTQTTARPEVASIGGCTATLISRQYFITASHCIGYQARSTGGTLTVTLNPPPAPPASPTQSFTIDAIYGFNGDPIGAAANNGLGRYDIAIGRLASSIPTSVALPGLIADREPIAGETVTAFGYGCNQKQPTQSGGGVKRFRTFTWPPTDVICPGDSGGPIFAGNLAANGPILAINSGFFSASGTQDILALPGNLKSRVEALLRSLDEGTQEPLESNIDRPGGDLPGMPLSAGSASSCRNLCSGRPDCKSFTFVGSNCWLKGSIPTAFTSSGVTSGVMLRGLELGLDRGGADITSFTATNAAACRDQCSQRSDCQSFSYVTSSSTCFVKGIVPSAGPNSVVTSGMSLSQAQYDLPGSDLSGMPLAGHTADSCEAACARRSDCRAYTFTATNGNCWLKSAAPAPAACTNCWSGIKKSLEVSVDRPGSDLAGMPLTGITSAATCQTRCVQRNDCRSFTWVSSANTCWLKGFVAGPVTGASGITSGVRRGIEVNVDRPGSDLSSVDLTDPVPEECQRRCEADAACQAWTLVTKPSGLFNGDVNRCFLKNAVPAAGTSYGVFSGRKGMYTF